MVNHPEFRRWFRRVVSVDFPLALEGITLHRIDRLFWGTEKIKTEEILALPQSILLPDTYSTYRLFGFFGHGLNSYGFYFTRIEPGVHVTLRTPYGGVFTTGDEHARIVAETISYADRVSGYIKRFCRLEICQNMGQIEVLLRPLGSMENTLTAELKGNHSETFWQTVISTAERM